MYRHEQHIDHPVPCRVMIVDDHRTFTDLVCLALRGEPDLDCVGAAHDPAEARVQVARAHPDLVVMDVDLGDEDGDGLDLTAELLGQRPAMLVVVLTAHCDAGVLRRAAAAGACALLPKGCSLRDLLSGLRHARHGDLFVHPELLRTLVVEQPDRGRQTARRPDLTPRETLVLQLLTEGRHVSSIACDLGISVHTCRGYVKTLLSKLGAHSQLEAVAIAGKHGLVDAAPRR